jgi:hypothetical protein
MSKDIEKAYIWAIKENFKALNNNTIEGGKGFINISRLLNNAEKDNYKIDYEKISKENFRPFNFKK